MLTHTDVCWRILTYSDDCWRLLAVSDVKVWIGEHIFHKHRIQRQRTRRGLVWKEDTKWIHYTSTPGLVWKESNMSLGLSFHASPALQCGIPLNAKVLLWNDKAKSKQTYIWVSVWWLKAKAQGSTSLTYTGLFGGLEHLKIETRLIDESFTSVMGECVILTSQVSVDIQHNP